MEIENVENFSISLKALPFSEILLKLRISFKCLILLGLVLLGGTFFWVAR